MEIIKEKIKIEVQKKYNWIFPLGLISALLVLIILPYFVFERTADQRIFEIIWIAVMSAGILLCLTAFAVSFQTATIDEQGVKINSLLGKIIFIEWSKLKKVDTQKLATMSQLTKTLYYEWIVLYTDFSQEALHGGSNRKKKGPWQIKATKHNIEIVKAYVEKYAPNVNFKTN